MSAIPIEPGEETAALARPRMLPMIDPLLLLAAMGLMACSLITLNGAVGRSLAERQGIYGAIGVLLALVLSRVDYSRLREYKYALLVIMVALNLVVYGMAPIQGARRWIPLPFMSFQSSEFGKVLVVVALAAFAVDRSRQLHEWRTTARIMLLALVAALIVIGQTGDVVRGAAALFAMSLGMGVPLLIVGSSAGRWMPRAGAWMDSVKRLFGALMLALAAWMLARIVPERWTLLLFAAPAIAAAIVLWSFVPAGHARRAIRDAAAGAHPHRPGGSTPALWLARGAALLAALYAVALLVGAGRGAEDPLQPLARRAATDDPAFTSISSVADLTREVQSAAAAHQAVMLDFYADWCTSCKEMQRYTFNDPGVRAALKSVRLLRADVTANSVDDQALLHQFQIYGPPTIAIYDAQGHEHQEYRVVGYMKAPEFAALLHQALATG